MAILITETILQRLVNINNVVQRQCQMAQKRQWRQMTLDNMQACQQAQDKARSHAVLAGYGLYLYRVQKGLRAKRPIYGEPLLHNALLTMMEELRIPVQQAEL